MKVMRLVTTGLCALSLLVALACSGRTGEKTGGESREEPRGGDASSTAQGQPPVGTTGPNAQGQPFASPNAEGQPPGGVAAPNDQSQPPAAAAAPVPSHEPGSPPVEDSRTPSTTALPPGHPPIEGQPGEAAGKEAPEGVALAWKVPAKWKEERPSSRMRRAQYRVPGVDGDAEDAQCVVFYFGPGQGGTPESNATRWIDQFKQPDGSSPQGHSKIEMRTVSGKQTMFVSVKGTYVPMAMPGMAAQEPKEGYALLGAIVSAPDAPWFFKLTGPARTVEANRAAFEAMIASIG